MQEAVKVQQCRLVCVCVVVVWTPVFINKPTFPGSHLEVLPAAAAGQVLHDEAVLRANRRPILLPASSLPAPPAAAVAATFRGDRGREITPCSRTLNR